MPSYDSSVSSFVFPIYPAVLFFRPSTVHPSIRPPFFFLFWTFLLFASFRILMPHSRRSFVLARGGQGSVTATTAEAVL